MQVDGFRIAVLDKGFVYVGDVSHLENGYIVITNAHNIRVWGTTQGLGELARKGKTTKTVADAVGTVLVPMHALQQLIVTEKSKWKL